NEEDVVTCALDLANRLGNAVGVGECLIDRVPQLLHQYFQTFFQDMPLSPEPGSPEIAILLQWMRPAARKFHFLKADTIVVDQNVLHKAQFRVKCTNERFLMP